MNGSTTLSRSEIAATLLAWTREQDIPLVVGNGFLAREVAAAPGRDDHVMYLLGGMGLAPAVACGVSRATERGVAALEGDGNHLMGLSGTATIGLNHAPIVHVVHWNGGWESTGGQDFATPGTAHDISEQMGYDATFVVSDKAGLARALDAAEPESSVMIHAIGQMGDEVAPRTALSMAENTERFRSWLADNGTRSEVKDSW